MQPRLKDIANALGVSTATVSNVLSKKGRVSPKLAARIQAEAMRQGYAPGGPGRALRTGRSGVMGLVLPDLSNPLFPRMAQALEREAALAGYGILIADSHGDGTAQQDAVARLMERGADGLILIPRRGARISTTPTPLVVIDTPSAPDNTVSADHRQGGSAIAQHLIAQGHRHLVLVGESPASTVQTDRIAGMGDALTPACRNETFWLERDSLRSIVAAVRGGATAIAATSDLVALRLLAALEEDGIAVPDRVALSGFDDLIFASIMRPSLTTVIADPYQIARHAVATLRALIAGDTPPPPARVPMTLILRNSTTTTIPKELIPC